MEQIIQSPGKYIQGIGAIEKIGAHAGVKSFVLADDFVMGITKEKIEKSFKEVKEEVVFEIFKGECSKNEVKRLEEAAKTENCKMIIGVGGGKTLDAAKAVGYFLKLPVMIVPTIASTDSPCTALTVFYHDDGTFDEYLFLPHNPDIILMDTDIIAKAPSRLLVAGMGDALATYFEVKSCVNSNSLNLVGGLPTRGGEALARLCFETLMEDGEKALMAAEKKVATKALNNIIEANTYLSGVGAESGGLGAAHSIHNGFTILKECHHLYHGEKVAFGTLAQLFLENYPMDEIEEVAYFCKRVGLPVSLEEMGIKEVDEEKIMEVAKASCAPGETIHNTPFKVTPEDVFAAIMTADNFGSSL
ncbi:glycerol dehydrogenase [Cetobacterium ceti]